MDWLILVCGVGTLALSLLFGYSLMRATAQAEERYARMLEKRARAASRAPEVSCIACGDPVDEFTMVAAMHGLMPMGLCERCQKADEMPTTDEPEAY